MNYLAHLALSGNDEQLIAGNYIGDSLRGVDVKSFPPQIQLGIFLHRFIDDFTDHHPIFISAKKVFTAKFDKYSGTIVDVCFDHFLAKNFELWYSSPLQDFAFKKYQELGKYYYLFPEKAKMFYQYMVQNNILFNYSRKEGILKVLEGLTQRLGNRVALFEAFEIFLGDYAQLESLFLEFYPELKAASEKQVLFNR
jgi:acyl carrier protein phosphodiesterase